MLSRLKIYTINIGLLIGAAGLISAAVLVMGKLDVTMQPVALIPVASNERSAVALAEYYFQPEVYDIAKARHYYETAIREDPAGHVLPWYQLSRINFIQGKFDASLHGLRKQKEYFGDEIPNVYYMKGLVYAFRADRYGSVADWERAETAFETFLEYEPDSPWARIDLAWVYFGQDRFTDMVDVLEPVSAEEIENPWWLNMYGVALLNLDEPERALERFLVAQEFAKQLAVSDWARVYPENDPADWSQGLREFQAVIDANVTIATERTALGGGN